MMRFAVRCGQWRSSLGDTWPHDKTVDLDWWPQGTHLVSESPPFVLCATGAGGGSQQAMFRSHLDPVLQRAHSRWQLGYDASTPAAAELDRLFTAIQPEFEELRDPPWAEQFQASAVALLIGAADCAVANVGVDRAWVLRDGQVERVSEDYSLGTQVGSTESDLPENLRDFPGSYFGRFGGMAARWQVRQAVFREGDVFVFASGFRKCGVSETQLGVELKQVISEFVDEAPGESATWHILDRMAERLGQRLAEIAERDGDFDSRKEARWYLHSRLALAVVRVAGVG
jgi:hypothetical protein